MERLLNQALGTVRDLLTRNRAALDAMTHALTSQGAGTLSGEARGPQFHPQPPSESCVTFCRRILVAMETCCCA